MRLGFIGTGQISKAVILGILKSKIKFNKILISKRNSKTSKFLSNQSKKISVLDDNQKILNSCDWVFLAVTPAVGNQILKKLNFKKAFGYQFYFNNKNERFKKIVKVKAQIVRAIPLPPISLKKGPVPIFPPNKKVKNFFNNLGNVVEISNENLSLNFWATSSMMAPFYEMLNNLSSWLINKGVKKESAQKYIASLFVALSEDAFVKSKDFKKLVKDSQTPKGLNEQSIKQLKKLGFYNSLRKTTESILKRLKKVK